MPTSIILSLLGNHVSTIISSVMKMNIGESNITFKPTQQTEKMILYTNALKL